jgi:hypothetical protein
MNFVQEPTGGIVAMEASAARAKHADDEESLAGRVALVTGGTRGIGAAISQRLAGRGAAVAAGFSSNLARAEEFRHTIQNGGGGASIHQATSAIRRTAFASWARRSSSTAGSTSWSTTPASPRTGRSAA